MTACQRRGSLALMLAASLAACGTSATGTATGPADFTADTGGDATTVDAPRIVSRITTGEGATVTFFNERDVADDPVISIAIASPDATPVMDALLAQRPSALELYRALQPAKAAPDELVREHRLLAQVDSAYDPEPRALTAASVAGSNGTEPFACGSFSHWKSAFDAWAPPLDGQYAATEGASTSGYVGYAPKFYFDVCRTTTSMWAWVVHTERRTSSAAAWSVFDDGSPLGGNERYRFFRNSFTCSSYQYRLFVNVVFGGSYYRGATWADEFSCQITG
ncbi:MAG TPA: hypothetical protein VFD36_25420 [Kofleriaceae bacterium]|nr:hypothetical protein [Kofleriaceae bacterium]